MKIESGAKIGKFVIGERLGDGAFADVWSLVGNDCCVKVQKNDAASKKAAENEVMVLGGINEVGGCKNIIKLLETFTIDGEENEELLCMVFKKYSCDVHEYRKKYCNGKIPVETANKIYDSLKSACNFLHDRNYIHTDIKPENALVELDSENNFVDVVLSDFGGCEKHTPGSYSSSLGTPEYQAPEIIVGYPYDYGIDKWALACTYYEMLTGEYLFDPTNHNDDRNSEKNGSSENKVVPDREDSWKTESSYGSYDSYETCESEDDRNDDIFNFVHLYHVDHLIGRMPEYMVAGGHYAGLYFDYKSRLFGMIYREEHSIRDFIETKISENKFPSDFDDRAKNRIIGILTNAIKYKSEERTI